MFHSLLLLAMHFIISMHHLFVQDELYQFDSVYIYVEDFYFTMQIRAQLAACGAPIVGDTMYMPAAIAEMTNPGLNPFGKHKRKTVTNDDKVVAVQEWSALHGKEPTVAIGLQASKISWEDDDGVEHYYEARSPWWREG